MTDLHSALSTASRRRPDVLRRALAAVATALIVGALSTIVAASGPPPTGTISCSIVGGDTQHGHGLAFRPFLAFDPRPKVTVRATNTDSACDNSGVVGGKAPIVGVLLKFIGKMPNGTCTELTSAPEFVNGRVKLKWRGLNPANHLMTVATSKADLASASFDGGSGALILTTQPITVGGFVGATAVLHLGLDDVARFESLCSGGNSPVVGQSFGQSNPSSVDVQ